MKAVEKTSSEQFYMGNGKYSAYQCKNCAEKFEILEKRPEPSYCPYCGIQG